MTALRGLQLPRSWSVTFWALAITYAVVVAADWGVVLYDALWPDPDAVGVSFAALPLILVTMPTSFVVPDVLTALGISPGGSTGDSLAAMALLGAFCWSVHTLLLRLVLVGVARLRNGSRSHGPGRPVSSST